MSIKNISNIGVFEGTESTVNHIGTQRTISSVVRGIYPLSTMVDLMGLSHSSLSKLLSAVSMESSGCSVSHRPFLQAERGVLANTRDDMPYATSSNYSAVKVINLDLRNPTLAQVIVIAL